MHRCCPTVLAVALASALIAGCGGKRSQPSAKLAQFRSAMGIWFSYPESWRTRLPDRGNRSHVVWQIAYLGAQPLQKECRARTIKGGTETICGWPVKELRPDSLVASVSLFNLPTPRSRMLRERRRRSEAGAPRFAPLAPGTAGLSVRTKGSRL